MSRNSRPAAIASLVLGLSLAGVSATWAMSVPDLDVGDVERLLTDEVPAIAGDVDGGIAGLLDGKTGLLGGILGGTNDLLGGVLDALGIVPEPGLSIQPVPSMEGSLAGPRIGGGLLDGLFGAGSITESLAGHV